MPRGPRIDAPGAAHHVIVRGIERRRIFEDERDYREFCRRLDLLIPDLGFHCFGWVLMPNHVHLALRTGAVPLSRLMARLGTGYASYFNRRHGRVGHLVQNRFKSRLVWDDSDLLGLVLYIHRNPLRARLVPDTDALERFAWSGHGALAGKRPARPFEATNATLRLLAEEPGQARRRLRERMSSELALPAGLASASAAVSLEPAELTELIRTVCHIRGLSPADLGKGRRQPAASAARVEIARRAERELGLPVRLVAHALGVSKSTLHRALVRAGANATRKDRPL